jgi:diguanylate cyclase (GGDEF)-like protein
VLELYWDRPMPIRPGTVELCVAVAEQAALAMDNARLYEEVAKRAETDPLTDLLNHRALLERLDGALTAGEPFALLLLDINDFKLFNDTYGHLVGDAVLMQVAGVLRDTCREHDRSARYGGDEFAVILRGVTPDEAGGIRERLSQTVRACPYVIATGEAIPLSLSVGIACYPRDGRSCHELIAVADAEMYAAKHGRKRRSSGGSVGHPARRGPRVSVVSRGKSADRSV